jgi:hypothetical protein
MLDRPSSMIHLLRSQFQGTNKATSVISRAHFTTYLVRGMDVLYKVNIDVEWKFTDENEPQLVQSVRHGEKAEQLEPGQRKRMLEQYPNFDYLP